MAIEIKIPAVGESVTEVQVGQWHKNEGDWVSRDTPLVTIETDKVSVDVTAPSDGRLERILLAKGAEVSVGEVVCLFDDAAKAPADATTVAAVGLGGAVAKPTTTQPSNASKAPASSEPKAPASSEPKAPASSASRPSESRVDVTQGPWASPSARRALAEHGLRAEDVGGGGGVGIPNRLLREDVERMVHASTKQGLAGTTDGGASAEFEEQIVPMSPLRKRVAARLVEAQQQAALLTTFNEVDMAAVQQLRAEEKVRFEEKHGAKLGLMSFFVRAVVEALKAVPVVNAEIRGTDIVYKNHYDIGIAVGSGKGLIVPVLRDVERLGFAGIEKAIIDFGTRAKANRIELHELQGGTFTISNGGVYGSMLSTPIVNPPQSAILGLHNIVDRPVARNGQVVIRPMMYVALTYDHRIIDGREAVTFLRKVKECIEQPMRILLEI